MASSVQARSSTSPLAILLKSFIALEKSLPSPATSAPAHDPSTYQRRWVCQRKNLRAVLRKVRVLSLLSQELLSVHTSLLPSPASSPPPSLASSPLHIESPYSSFTTTTSQTSNPPFPSGVLLCFGELKSTLEKLKQLIKGFESRSCIWQVLQHKWTSHALYELNHDMASALDILPLHLLHVSEEIKEQVHLVYTHFRQTELETLIDPSVEALRTHLVTLVHEELQQVNASDMQSIFTSLNLSTFADCQKEIELLEDEMNAQAGTGGIPVVCIIRSLISFVKHAQCLVYGAPIADSDNFARVSCSSMEDLSARSLTLSEILTIPDEFRCPISLELMKDPVVVATGHTYERSSIAKWIESGHSTCPKSGQRLLHVSLIPNYALRRLIHQWCVEHGIPCDKDEDLVQEEAEDHISLRQAALKTTKETVAFLVGKLATGSSDVQRQVVYELRLLAKCGMENRICVAEAGAIPFLVPLLTSPDPRTQENAITALLNLSICESNKSLIMAAGALDAVVEVLRAGATIEAKENAAATLFSLSLVNDYKVAIGAKPNAIPALLSLMREGSSRGKKDAATALFNLSIYTANKAKAVEAGAVPLLVDILTDERAGITDDALAVLAVLAGTTDGLMAINQAKAIPVLVELLRLGSEKGKENAIAVLLALSKNGGGPVLRSVCSISTALPSLESLAEMGSARAKRKASSLLKLINKHHRN